MWKSNKPLRLFCITIIVASFYSLAYAGDKVTICHYPPGNTDNPQTITINSNALPAHLAHGDILGECPNGCNIDPLICDDGNLCTNDICLENGECQHEPVDCDDGNVCTYDTCVPLEGCVATPINDIPCDDGNACTENDTCYDTLCVGNSIAECCLNDSDCDDGDLCTNDVCAGNSCSNEPIDCTSSDKCFVGFCNPETGSCDMTPVSCDDSNVCTDDYCDDTTGCINVPTSSPPETQESTCDDLLDNDCDENADCADTDCAADPACINQVQKQILITEIMANQQGTEAFGEGEFVELINTGDLTVNLDGLWIAVGDPQETSAYDQLQSFRTGTTLLLPGAYAVIVDPDYDDRYTFASGTVVVTIGDANFGYVGIAVTHPVTLYDVDSITLIDEFGCPQDPGDGVSLCRISLTVEVEDECSNWAESPIPSPGDGTCAD